MNLLPFVITIVLILGMFSLSQFENANSLQKEKNIYVAYFEGLRKARNHLEDSAYKRRRESNSKRGTSSSSKAKDEVKELPFFRERKLGWSGGRLNLSALLSASQKYRGVEKIAVEYLEALYGTNDTFPKNLKPLLKALIVKLTASEELTPLHEVELDDPKMQALFYKMLRGTQTYDLMGGEGYPPFDHFFTFQGEEIAPINFHSASELLLEVVLGKSGAEELIERERAKVGAHPNALKSPLKRGEIELLLGEKLPLFNLKTQKTIKNPESYTDQETKITVRIE
ncbi:MAG: hypothetical protein K1060chlam2_01247 [Chlamydiae bacterium]|nr:hypothetical protein [Chlamydiota bacterium]